MAPGKLKAERPGGAGIRDLLAGLGHRPRKSLGQHFLADRHAAGRIVDLAGIGPDEDVVEIGPGLGALTDLLAERARELWIVEIDPVLARHLRTHYEGTPNVHVVEADVLELNFAAHLGDRRAVVVANLPYNIAAAVLTRLLQEPERFARMVLMLQREVAVRLRAEPGSKDYGVLSVLTQFAACVQPGFRVGPRAFVPPPKVESEVILVSPRRQPPVPVADVSTFRRVVRTCFNQRRKQLGNSLRPLTPDAPALLRQLGIDPKRRAETLSLAEFAAVSNALSAVP